VAECEITGDLLYRVDFFVFSMINKYILVTENETLDEHQNRCRGSYITIKVEC
jgi:hypothetical protein